MTLFRRRQSGQAMPVIGLFGITLFLFMGLGIDSGMLYLQRRHLQNITDSACLAAATDMVMGKTKADADKTAQIYVKDNLNENGKHAFNLSFPLSDSFLPITTSGSSLTHGVHITDAGDIRVAVTAPASTYFLRVGGIDTYNVMARTRCSAVAGGGLSPIAVNRFPGYDEAGKRRLGVADTSVTLPQYYSGGKNPKTLQVRDVLQQDQGASNRGVLNEGKPLTTGCGTKKRNWYGWGTVDYPKSLSTTACPEASPSAPGPELEIVGKFAKSNVGDTSFSGAVVLDARQISTGPVYYNTLVGSGTNLNAWKATVFEYILKPYPGPDVEVGEQLGYVSGINAGPLISAFDARFDVGDPVTTLVYDGTVHRVGDFKLSIACKASTSSDRNPNCNTDGAYAFRDAPPVAPATGADPLFSTNCNDFNGSYYLAVPGNPATTISAKTNPWQEALYPAKYMVTLEKSSSTQTVTLSARVSGANPGSGDDFGGMSVRWNGGSWQTPNTAFSITLPANTVVNVQLDVIQTATTTRTCTKSNGTTVSHTVPDHVYGAHKLQVIGQGSAAQLQHSVYATVAMLNNSQTFNAGDYFFSVAEDPSGTASTDSEIDVPLQFIVANSNLTAPEVELDCSTLVCSSASATISSGPLSAQIVAVDNYPVLRIKVPAGTTPGQYAVDVQWNSPITHSTRYYVTVADPVSPSVKQWVVVLCYARFKITEISTNGVKAKAISGCIDPEKDPAKLLSTSRILSWDSP